MKDQDIALKFQHLHTVISLDKFLKMEALGGEIPFFISTYAPQQENDVKTAIHHLARKLNIEGIRTLELDLYKICIDILKSELGPDEIFTIEKDMSKPDFLEALRSLLDIQEVLIPYIRDIVTAVDARVYFLTGVGHVYPFLRSHNILNNLQNVIRDAPTVMFFPGEYTGHSLELFGLFKDDNYYRAFNLDKYKI